MYANAAPNAPYGMIYSNSIGDVILVTTCNAPNTMADKIINNHLFGKAFLNPFLNIISSVQGAINPALINMSQGREEIIDCTACSFAACPRFITNVMIIFEIIIIPSPTNQYLIPISMFSKKFFLKRFHSSIKSFLKIKNRIINNTQFENVDNITFWAPVILFKSMLNNKIGISWK